MMETSLLLLALPLHLYKVSEVGVCRALEVLHPHIFVIHEGSRCHDTESDSNPQQQAVMESLLSFSTTSKAA